MSHCFISITSSHQISKKSDKFLVVAITSHISSSFYIELFQEHHTFASTCRTSTTYSSQRPTHRSGRSRQNSSYRKTALGGPSTDRAPIASPLPPAPRRAGPRADSRSAGPAPAHRPPGAAPGPAPAAPRTFFGLGVGDLQVAVSRLQLLAAHDLALEVAQGDVQPVEGDRIIVQLGRELVMDARHGRGRACSAPAAPRAPRRSGPAEAREGPTEGTG